VLNSRLQGQLLVAQPSANSSFFSQTVIMVAEHTITNGAWGLVINRPSMVADVRAVAEAFDIPATLKDQAYVGGPVHGSNVYFIHTGDCIESNSIQITNNIWITSSVNILNEVAQGRGPHRWRMCLGTSTWAPGQLEGEQSGEHPWTPQHRWLTLPTTNDILEKPVQSLWKDSVTASIKNSVDSFF